jgi:hypothetical protein
LAHHLFLPHPGNSQFVRVRQMKSYAFNLHHTTAILAD